MTKKTKLVFKKGIEIEIKKGLNLNSENFESFIKIYNIALEKDKKDFPFRSDEGKLFKIETSYITFFLKTLSTTKLEEIQTKSNDYKERQEANLKEEIKLAIKENEEEMKEGFNEEITPVREWRRTLYQKHIKNK
tara:strand:- start:83 stop:487 length:405 start_codon:yes stop_codon:yes gene_type:complete